MCPIATNIRLHHVSTQHVGVLVTIAFKKSTLLVCHWCVLGLVESVGDQVDDLLALLLGKYAFWRTSIQEAFDRHWMLKRMRIVATQHCLIRIVWLILIRVVHIAVYGQHSY